MNNQQRFGINAYYGTSYYTTGTVTNEQFAALKRATLEVDRTIKAAEKILGNDALWKKAVAVFEKGTPIQKQMAINRVYFREMIQKLSTGISEYPPRFALGVPSNESSLFPKVGKGGQAYCLTLHGEIYLRPGPAAQGFFNQSALSQQNLLFHEYGRTYFWESLTNQENTTKEGTTGQFDLMLEAFRDTYKKILDE